MKLFDMLEELYNSIRYMSDNNSTGILPDKTSDGSKKISDAYLVVPDVPMPVISLEEGIQAFKNEEHEKAWKCFDFHAENNNVVAKYWKGRYLWDGYHDDIKEREEGKQLL